MAKLMENMFVEYINAILGNHSTSANSPDLMETTEAPKNFPKHRGGNEKAENRYCETDSHANPLILPQDSPLQNVVNGSTASKNVNSHNFLEIGTKLPQMVLYIHQEVLKKRVKLGELTAYDIDSFFKRTILIGQK